MWQTTPAPASSGFCRRWAGWKETTAEPNCHRCTSTVPSSATGSSAPETTSVAHSPSAGMRTVHSFERLRLMSTVAGTRLAAARVAQHVGLGRERLDGAVDELGQLAAHARGVLDDGLHVVLVRVAGTRQAAAVARVGEALEAVLVAVVDGGDAREVICMRVASQNRALARPMASGVRRQRPRSSSGSLLSSGPPPSTLAMRGRSWLPSRLRQQARASGG